MLLKASLVAGLTAWLYYRTLLAVPMLSPVWAWYYRSLERECMEKKRRKFEAQFKEMIQTVSSALNTGYSIENAIKESQKELRLLYSEREPILREVMILVRGLKMQMPVEQAIEEMAQRVDIEAVENFAAVFATAKRSGGDIMAIIRSTASQIADKIDVQREIATVLAAKKYEFKVMSAIPYGIIAYMSLSFPDFMMCLYGNMFGIGVMTICILIYIGAYYLGTRLTEIEV